MTKRRRYPRVLLGIDTPLPAHVGLGRKHHRGNLTVLGAGGACLEVAGSFPVESVIDLRFTLPGFNRDIVCRGVVRHEQPGYGIGVEFTDLKPPDRELIREAVRTWIAKERALSAS